MSSAQPSTEVVTTPSVSRRVLVNSVRDFSNLQGRRNWYFCVNKRKKSDFFKGFMGLEDMLEVWH